MAETFKIWCCQCEEGVQAVKVTGKDIYPHRKDLYDLQFWRCRTCKNYVGVHKRTGIPLGVIPTLELRNARKLIHEKMDPLWQEDGYDRTTLYLDIAELLGMQEFHTAHIRTIEEARDAYRAVLIIVNRVKAAKRRHNHMLDYEDGKVPNEHMELTLEKVYMFGGGESYAVYEHRKCSDGQVRKLPLVASKVKEDLLKIYPEARRCLHES